MGSASSRVQEHRQECLCHKGNTGAKNAALKAAALSATADANGAHDDECRDGRMGSASEGAPRRLFMSELKLRP